ncbi:hypothetical protein CALVIDRAFT_566472 [Calocera viscosa TUFC12733]|uniref:Uncharacterized protein n=1 Tax=Calocera viscosa (strain TUFC12733) TaxID=1330018 RepID=A0A167JD13_CALVF|nr:hypothetical protein CALVIDRAFT_566472 [Calocera viscosa TUFC12733]
MPSRNKRLPESDDEYVCEIDSDDESDVALSLILQGGGPTQVRPVGRTTGLDKFGPPLPPAPVSPVTPVQKTRGRPRGGNNQHVVNPTAQAPSKTGVPPLWTPGCNRCSQPKTGGKKKCRAWQGEKCSNCKKAHQQCNLGKTNSQPDVTDARGGAAQPKGPPPVPQTASQPALGNDRARPASNRSVQFSTSASSPPPADRQDRPLQKRPLEPALHHTRQQAVQPTLQSAYQIVQSVLDAGRALPQTRVSDSPGPHPDNAAAPDRIIAPLPTGVKPSNGPRPRRIVTRSIATSSSPASATRPFPMQLAPETPSTPTTGPSRKRAASPELPIDVEAKRSRVALTRRPARGEPSTSTVHPAPGEPSLSANPALTHLRTSKPLPAAIPKQPEVQQPIKEEEQAEDSVLIIEADGTEVMPTVGMQERVFTTEFTNLKITLKGIMGKVMFARAENALRSFEGKMGDVFV